MPRYHFDMLDGDTFIPDETGIELLGVELARAEAARSLADKVRDLPTAAPRQITVEVSDGEGRPIFRASLYAEIEDLT